MGTRVPGSSPQPVRDRRTLSLSVSLEGLGLAAVESMDPSVGAYVWPDITRLTSSCTADVALRSG